MGSMVAQLTAQRTPDLISSVVLFGYPIDPAREFGIVADPTEPKRHVNTAEAAASDFITPNSISSKAIKAYVEACLVADPIKVDWRKLSQWSELDPQKLNLPVLLMQGEFSSAFQDRRAVAVFYPTCNIGPAMGCYPWRRSSCVHGNTASPFFACAGGFY
ncbi:lysophospholipase [Mariniblastus sp.]|nr:lysophospholipase [Mariniblastus sp.]